MAVYFAVLKPGDTILGMNLAHGGHLTHGHHAELLRQALQGRPLRRAQGRRAHRLRRGRDAGATSTSPKLIVAGASAYPRVIDFARIRRRSRTSVGALLMVDMAHIAGLVAGGPAPEPGAARRLRHHHHAQDAARPARRHDPVPAGVRQGDRPGGLPRHPGRAADARHRRQGGVLRRGAAAGVQATTSSRSSPTRRRWPTSCTAQGFRLVSRRHRQPPDAGRRVLARASPARSAEEALDEAGITVNKNTIPFDTNRRWTPAASASARRRSPRAAWAKPEMERIAEPDRRARWRRPTTTRALREGQGRGRSAVPGVPAVPARPGLLDGVRRVLGPGARWPRVARRLRAAPRPAAMAEAVARVVDRRRRAAGRGGHGHRQDAGLPRAGDPRAASGAGLHRHPQPPAADYRQGRAAARAGARRRSAPPA